MYEIANRCFTTISKRVVFLFAIFLGLLATALGYSGLHTQRRRAQLLKLGDVTRRGGISFLFLTVLLTLFPSPVRAGDPWLRWYTIETEHFRINFHGGQELRAQKLANYLELLRTRIGDRLHWYPQGMTEIVIEDISDEANGSATGLPYNTIRLYSAPPGDLSTLEDYDNFEYELIAHEYTHITHIDRMSGIPQLVNTIFGRLYAPNQNQPRWILEGLAVLLETESTSAGRLRSSFFDMMIRTDVLENNFVRLDQLNNRALRWPTGSIPYLYGSEFVSYISRHYGGDIFGAVAADYGDNIIPYGINRSIIHATGQSYEESFPAFEAEMRQLNEKRLKEIEQWGGSPVKRLSTTGGQLSSPIVASACGEDGSDILIYYRADQHTVPGIYSQRLDQKGLPLEGSSPELIERSNGTTQIILSGHCEIIYDTIRPSQRRHYFYDLQSTCLPQASEACRPHRLSRGQRYRQLSLLGDRAIWTAYRKNRWELRQGDYRDSQLSSASKIKWIESIQEVEADPKHPAQFRHIFNPVQSPDGRYLAASVMSPGGYRDLMLFDLENRSYRRVTHSRSLSLEPRFSPDGSALIFSTDRGGVFNIHAYRLKDGETRQITASKTGAFYPSFSKDGKRLYLIEYHSHGYELATVEYDFEKGVPPQPTAERPIAEVFDTSRQFPTEDYAPLKTLAPRAWALTIGPGTYGTEVQVSLLGFDVAKFHRVEATLVITPELGRLQGGIQYQFTRLPYDLNISAGGALLPRLATSPNGSSYRLSDQVYSLSSGVFFPIPDQNQFQGFGLSYAASMRTLQGYNGASLDPNTTVQLDTTRFQGTARATYQYSNIWGSNYGFGAEQGVALQAMVEYAGAATASDLTLVSASGRGQAYVQNPWIKHHVLSTSLGGGMADGTSANFGYYYIGGYTNTNWSDAVSGSLQPSFVLRGFSPGQFVGDRYALLNTAYRFPIIYADRGISTLPFYLRSLSGSLTLDYGGAYFGSQGSFWSNMHLGLGAELRFDLMLGYSLGTLFKLGYAYSWDAQAIPGGQIYAVFASDI